MAGKPWDPQGEARRALEVIVTDPYYGADALSKPTVMANLLEDLLPDQPREAGLLVAAAHADLATTLRRYREQGLDARTATRLTARTFADSTSHTQEACTWVVGELGHALGFGRPVPVSDSRPVPVPQAGAAQGEQGGSDITEVPPPASGTNAGPAAPHPGRPASRSAVLAGGAAIFFLLLACVAPYAQFPGEPPSAILTGVADEPGSETFWLALEPAAILLVAVGATIALLVPRRMPRLTRLLPGMLVAFGFQTILLFAGYSFALAGSRHEAGGFLGLTGGAALLTAGLLTMGSQYAVRRQPNAASPGRGPRPLIVTLAAAGVLAIVAGVLWLAGAAPGFLNAGSAAETGSHHAWRGIAAAVGGLGAVIGAWLLARKPAPRGRFSSGPR